MALPSLIAGGRRRYFVRLVLNGFGQATAAIATALLIRHGFDTLIVTTGPSFGRNVVIVGLGLLASAAVAAWLHKQERVDAERLGQGDSVFLVIEMDSSALHLGKVQLFMGGEAGPSIVLERDPEKEPSEDAAFASLVCAFGHWLSGEDAAYIDDSVVLGLAREVASGTLVPDRYDFLALIDQAMKLTEK